MTLTPIHVKRKRKSPGTNIPRALSIAHPSPILKPPNTKRPLAAIIAARALRPRPRLDSLPDELLEHILLLSANLALPRASILIGKKLSARATLLRTVILAFGPTWAHGFGIPLDRALTHGPWPPIDDPDAVPGDPELQTAVLLEPWAKVDVLLQAQQTWADRHARNAWYSHVNLPAHLDSPESHLDSHDHDLAGGFAHFRSHDCFAADYAIAQSLPPSSPLSPSASASPSPSLPAFQDIHPRTRIPTPLITGPWTPESRQRLFWLCRGGFRPAADIHAGQPHLGWEVKLQLIHNAVLRVPQPDGVVVACLLGGWVLEGLPRELEARVLVALRGRLGGLGGYDPNANFLV